MATDQRTIDFLADQITAAGNIRSRKMFGEYAIYCDEKVVALVCDDQLFIKPTAAGRTFLGTPAEAPPYPGAKPYFRIPEDRWDDHEWLTRLVRLTADALPLPKPQR
jgi:DNA transformation protein